MSKADELLNSLGEEAVQESDVTVYAAAPEEEPHVVIGNDRFITVPEMLKRIAVQFDHNIETITFDCPRYWDNIDMSVMKIYVNYICADKTIGSDLAENITIDENDTNIMHFTWTISRKVTTAAGRLAFLICIKHTDAEGNEAVHWNSELNNDMYISEGLETGEPITNSYPDIITDLLVRMSTVEVGFSDNDKSFHELEADVNSYTSMILQALTMSKEALDRVTGDLSNVYDYYFQIGDAMPDKTPCIWIDTSETSILELSEDTGASDIYAVVNSVPYAITNAGVNTDDKTYNFDIR